jgi:hypothetical protein
MFINYNHIKLCSGIAQSVTRRATRLTAVVLFQAATRFSLLLTVQTNPESPQASCPMGIGSTSPGDGVAGE